MAKFALGFAVVILSLLGAQQGAATSNVGIEAERIEFSITDDSRVVLSCRKGRCVLNTTFGRERHKYQHDALFGQDAARPYRMEVFSGIDGFNKDYFVVRVPVDCRADGEMQCARSVLIRLGEILSSDYVVLSHK